MNINNSGIGIVTYVAFIITLMYFVIKKKWYVLDKRNLFKQNLFLISIGVPFISFLYFGLFSWWGKTPVLSAHGYARFYEISKFPLLILASSVPLASIVNNIHRTIQTESQILTAESKNAIDRYIAHEKNFVEKIKEIGSFQTLSVKDAEGKIKMNEKDPTFKMATSDVIRISNPYLLYKKSHPTASMNLNSEYDVDMDFINKIRENLAKINISLSPEAFRENANKILALSNLNTTSYNVALLLDNLCVDSTSLTCYQINISNNKIKLFTADEYFFSEVLEAAYHLSRKLIYITTGQEAPFYENLHNYIYEPIHRFSIFKHAKFMNSFYSPSWLAYVSKEVEVINIGDNLAAAV